MGEGRLWSRLYFYYCYYYHDGTHTAFTDVITAMGVQQSGWDYCTAMGALGLSFLTDGLGARDCVIGSSMGFLGRG